MKTIVLISSGQPSVNPRLVKEADALSSFGYKVFVIYSFWTNWAWYSDINLFENARWIPILGGGSPFEKIEFLITRIRFKIFNLMAKFLTFNLGIAEIAKGRAYIELLRKTKSIKADLYIAHNLAALPIAVKAAKLYHAKCGFDAEDFHRQEVTDDKYSFDYKINKYLEDKYLKQLDYMTAASPLIAKEYKELYPQLNPVLINNVFSIKYPKNTKFVIPNSPLKMFWFSQTIGIGRGIEDVIKAIGLLQDTTIILSLLGECNEKTKILLIELAYLNSLEKSQLLFIDPVQPEEIFEIASGHDIGLALEQHTPFNRDICLTNKIFTYLNSGLAVIASETSAQKQFMEDGDVEKLAEIINDFYYNRDSLNICKSEALKLSEEKYNWEIESKKLIEILKKVI
ncbi:MAG: hypothetical protein EAZ53_08990 [Bacteroidetes bacterium]|nr:MAG: hypothetical protein EAZ53_08990 [Bacteroidota bacterium]